MPPPPSETVLPMRRALPAAAGMWALLVGGLFVPRIHDSGPVWLAVLVAAAICGLWLLIVALRARRGRALEAVVAIRRPHWVQIGMHATIFVYWGLYVPQVADQAALILIQIPLAYLIDLLFAWSRGRRWSLGFGPVPIIGSINLFLWFRDDWFAWQLVMVFLAFAGREFIRWNWQGRNRHVFNPSGFALSSVSLVVIAFGASDITWGNFIATTPEVAPYMFEVMFAVGVVVMLLFRVTGTTVAAALTVWGLGALYAAFTGHWLFTGTAIPIAVFLGMNLLITDPATSPGNTAGRMLFGVGYGVAVMLLYVGLQAIDTPSFYDKLLQVPLLNLLAPALHRAGAAIEARLPRPGTAGGRNLVLVGAWVVAFALLRPWLIDHPGDDPDIWRARCAQGEAFACRRLRNVLLKGCGIGQGERCHAVALEFVDPTRIDRDPVQALHFFRRGCALGHGPSCARLEERTAAEAGDTGDTEGTHPEALQAACERADGDACMALAGHHIRRGEGWRVPPTLEKGCDAEHPAACVNLGLMYLRGDGVPADPARGAALHRRACDLGLALACGRLGVLYDEGRGVPRDPAAARQAWRKACDGGDPSACLRVEAP